MFNVYSFKIITAQWISTTPSTDLRWLTVDWCVWTVHRQSRSSCQVVAFQETFQCCNLWLQWTVVVFICEYLLCNLLNAVEFRNGNYNILWTQMTFPLKLLTVGGTSFWAFQSLGNYQHTQCSRDVQLIYKI